MARLSNEAAAQLNRLADHYVNVARFEAADRMFESVQAAFSLADQTGARGRPFPATYARLARPGVFWIKVHRYWFCYVLERNEVVIIRVFYDQADIPGRLDP